MGNQNLLDLFSQLENNEMQNVGGNPGVACRPSNCSDISTSVSNGLNNLVKNNPPTTNPM